MKIIFIRHGMTAGNAEKRYIGMTDEPLSDNGRNNLKNHKYPAADLVIASPMKRCIETARIIYPNKSPIIYEDFRECDFGDFEGKNYTELTDNTDYQKWIDSGGEMTFPNGENPSYFRKRCCDGFLDITEKYSNMMTLALVVHGGTIMSVLAEFAQPERTYYDWNIGNGCGYVCEWDGNKIIVITELK